MKEGLLQEIAEYTKTAGNVVVEAAHIYVDKEPSCEQFAGALVASTLLGVITAPTHKMLFVDDFHPTVSTLDIVAYKKLLADLGYPVDQVVMEATLEEEAHHLVRKIKEIVPNKKLSPKKPDGTKSLGLWVPGGEKVPLLKQNGDPTCHLLDACLYIKKAELGDMALTVLPHCYIEQQAKTTTLLHKIGHHSPIMNVFFDPVSPLESMTVRFSGGISS